MAITCKYCGTELPRDDARFCNNCGMLVPSHPFNLQSLSASKSDADSSLSPLPAKQQEDNKPALREQVAYLPPTRPTRRPAPNTLPVWPDSQRFDPSELKKSVSEQLDADRVEKTSGTQDGKIQEKLPETPRPETRKKSLVPGVPALPAKEVHAVEDLPTRPMTAAPIDRSKPEEQGVEVLPTSPLDLSAPEQAVARERPTEDMPTRPMSVSSPTPPPFTPPPIQEHGNASAATATQKRENIVSVPVGPHPRRRFPFVIAAVLLVVLVVGGVGIWNVSYQPFSVAPITQPQLSFSDTNLGIALSYPNGWTKQVEPDKSTVQFYASNHTAEVHIVVANAGSGDVNQALQQQSTKLGMGGAKAGAPLTFAGQTWQQLQGNLQQSGANYTGTILATVQGNHVFTIVEIAPQGNYTEWENQFFSPMRKTLRFL